MLKHYIIVIIWGAAGGEKEGRERKGKFMSLRNCIMKIVFRKYGGTGLMTLRKMSQPSSVIIGHSIFIKR